MAPKSYDPVWDEIYGGGNAPRSPYDFIASFVFRNAPRDRNREDVKILEVGCGAGNNLWFLAGEGFRVSGLDGSADAIAYAEKRLSPHNGLYDLRVGDFTDLPYADESYDLIFDRGALTCCGTSAMIKALAEIHRCLKPEGCFFFNPIADSDSSYRAGTPADDGLTVDIKGGDFAGVGQIKFVARNEIPVLMPEDQWHYERIERVEITDLLNPFGKIVASWRIEARKK